MTPGKRAWIMACLVLGIVLVGLDAAIANIALPTIGHALEASGSASVWVVNSYNLTVTMLLLPAAALGEIFGLKRVYVFGLTLFTLASLACALSPTLSVLVGARAIQGVGGASMAALSGALVREVYPRAMLGKAFAIVALAVAISAALGPTVAALVLSVAHWPWLFAVNVPLGALAVPLFSTIMPASIRRPRPLDFAGALLSAATLGLVVLGVDGLGGDRAGLAVAELAASVVCGAALVWQQRHRSSPMLPLDLLRIPLFALSIATSICAYAAQILAYLSLPFLFQMVMHRSAVATGLLVTPWPLLVAFAAPFAGKLSARYPAAILGSIGTAVLACGLLLLATMPATPVDPPADWQVAWRMGVCGLGFGFYQTPNNLTLMTAGPANRTGAASAMQAVARTLGWSLGSAMVALVLALDGPAGAVSCLWLAAGFAAIGSVISVLRTGTPSAPPG